MAKQFRFRFETMLRIRRQREDEHKRIVADRIRQLGEARDELETLYSQISEETSAIRIEHAPGTFDPRSAITHRNWLMRLHKNVLETQNHIRFLESQLAQDRVALAEAARHRQVLEKLKEHQLERFKEEQARLEQREADDESTIRYTFEHSEAIHEPLLTIRK
jgi:flagellar FliJ protein